MIYMRNITITTAKSATYLENVGLYRTGNLVRDVHALGYRGQLREIGQLLRGCLSGTGRGIADRRSRAACFHRAADGKCFAAMARRSGGPGSYRQSEKGRETGRGRVCK